MGNGVDVGCEAWLAEMQEVSCLLRATAHLIRFNQNLVYLLRRFVHSRMRHKC